MYINLIVLLYGLTYIVISLILIKKIGKVKSSSLINIYWAFISFSILKALAILSGLSAVVFSYEDLLILKTVKTLSDISSNLYNIFLFHLGISMLTYKTSIRLNYKIFPLLLFLPYVILDLTGIIDVQTSEKIGRHFGFTGSFLAGFGCFNLLITKIKLKQAKWFSGLITCGIALFLYTFIEEILVIPPWGIPIELLRLCSAMALLSVPLYLVKLLEEGKTSRIGYV